MNDYGAMSGFGMGFGWIIPLLFIAMIIYFINSLIKGDSSAQEILDRRYADGEIDEEEYKAKKAALLS
jgi:putative membrane protein